MKRILLLIFFLIGFLTIQAQSKHTISGYIYDESGESLIGANVYVKDKMIGTVTNSYGFFSITLPQGDYIIEIKYVGFESQEFAVDLSDNHSLSVNLKEANEMIEGGYMSKRVLIADDDYITIISCRYHY